MGRATWSDWIMRLSLILFIATVVLDKKLGYSDVACWLYVTSAIGSAIYATSEVKSMTTGSDVITIIIPAALILGVICLLAL